MQALYLPTRGGTVYASVHTPERATATRPTGVIMCPPYGWDDHCTYRIRRTWASALARAGHPVLRLDLPGTGDSSGGSDDPRRVRSWLDALGDAAEWLRWQFDCPRVCAGGIGLGGMLAYQAKADGAAIDDLMLWAVPLRGSRLLRELHAAAQLGIDWRRSAAGEDGAAVLGAGTRAGELLDESGEVTSAETVASIQRLDVRHLVLPSARTSRVLVFARSGIDGDARLIEHLEGIGAELTVADGGEYHAMMQYVQKAAVPRRAIARSLAWLADARPADVAIRRRAPAPPPAARRAELRYAGSAVRETLVSIALPDGAVSAVVTEPVTATPIDLCAVFGSGGSDRRTGPNRMWVKAARRWAAQGVTSVRLDLPGIGDSDGDGKIWNPVRAHYDPRNARTVVTLLDGLAELGLPRRFLMVGYCAGAYRSLHVGLADRRVVGVIAATVPFLQWSWWIVNVRDSWLGNWEPQPTDSAVKATFGTALQRAIKAAQEAHRGVVWLGQFTTGRAERVLRRLDDRGVDTLLLLSPSSLTDEQLRLPVRRRRVRHLSHIDVLTLPGYDHLFRPVASQRFVNSAMDAALARAVARTPVPAR